MKWILDFCNITPHLKVVTDLLNQLITLNQTQNDRVMSAFEDLKEKFTKQSETIANVAADVKFLKDKLAAGSEGGLSKEEVAELFTIVDGTNASLESLDAETDSSTPDDGGDEEETPTDETES